MSAWARVIREMVVLFDNVKFAATIFVSKCRSDPTRGCNNNVDPVETMPLTKI